MSAVTGLLTRWTGRPSAAVLEEERVQGYATALLADAREELVRADQKASILLAAAGVVVGALFASLLSGEGPGEDLGALMRGLWWGGALLGLVGVGCFGWAVFPRTGTAGGRTEIVGFYADVAAYADGAALRRALAVSSHRDLDRTVAQLREVSRIVAQKYRLVRSGILLFGGAVVCQVAVLATQNW